MMKFAFKYFGYRFRQYRRKTNEKIVVETEYGPVKGVKRISCWNDPFYSFERIPFAKPPLGELRFREPQEPEPWTVPLDCAYEADMPMQLDFVDGQIKGSEDCLYLNIFTKEINPDKPKPVMVWIHGGGFVIGGTSKDMYSPDYFMQKDVVIVTLGYRIGLLGFLSLKDPSLNIPGNAGLKDQIQGLRWLKNNISKFGGDPNNITMFGESAGGASIHYLTASEQARGLFHKAILMSGTVMSPWAILPDIDLPYRLAKSLGFEGENDEADILGYLRDLSASTIASAGSHLITQEEKREYILFSAGPVIEPYVSDHCVVPKDPRLMIRECWGNDIPIVLGGTTFEGLFHYLDLEQDMDLLKNAEDCKNMVPSDLNVDRESDLCKEYGLVLKKFHFGDNEPTVHSYLNLMSFKLFWHSIHRTLLSRLKYSKAPTYLYRFNSRLPGFNFFSEVLLHDKFDGVAHADDVSHLFFDLFAPEVQPDSREYKGVQQFVGLWVEFATMGRSDLIKSWRPVKEGDNPFKCLDISDELKIIDYPYKETLGLWDSLYSDDLLI